MYILFLCSFGSISSVTDVELSTWTRPNIYKKYLKQNYAGSQVKLDSCSVKVFEQQQQKETGYLPVVYVYVFLLLIDQLTIPLVRLGTTTRVPINKINSLDQPT
jgi:hypothetical protein